MVGDGLSGIGGALLYNEDRKRGSYLQRGCVFQCCCFDGTVRPKDNQGEPSGQELPLCIANALLSSKHKDEVGAVASSKDTRRLAMSGMVCRKYVHLLERPWMNAEQAACGGARKKG